MRWLTGLGLISVLTASGQPRILHFTRTSGFDHGTRAVSYTMFQSIAQELGATVDDDQSGDPFSDVVLLSQYDVILFSNTSGNAILNAQQRTNFEMWVANGGHVLGIHAASDTYRHSTANGNNTGSWDFYAELIGASVQENPNHVAGTPQYSMQLIGTHASTTNLPDPWVKNEEYYYWEGGYWGPDNTEVLRVEETVGPNGQVNSYDAPRPMSWYRILPNGSRVFYTALGHAPDNFTSDMLFRTHIKDAVAWLLDGTTGMLPTGENHGIHVYPNPATDVLHVHLAGVIPGQAITLYDGLGREARSIRAHSMITRLDLDNIPSGSYLLRIAGMILPVQIIR